MKRQRVFVSSVIDGFGGERAAARAAIESLRHEPIMAEHFGAKPYSAQMACLEGVRDSDVYVGVFGERYGYITKTGRSVTEEEFNEARHRGVSVLCFVKKGALESAQREFLDRFKSYEEGYHLAFFDTVEELQLQVVQALHDLVMQPGVSVVDVNGAIEHLDGYRWGAVDVRGGSEAWLGAVLFPARQGEEYLSVQDLSGKRARDRFLQPALFGAHPMLDPRLGTVDREGESSLAFVQDEAHGTECAGLEIQTDGSLVLQRKLGRRDRTGFDLTGSFLIDQDEVREALVGLLEYAHGFYAALERGALIAHAFLGVSLSGISHKTFGVCPDRPMHSVPIPMHQLDDPLCLPRPPVKVPRASLGNPDVVAREVVEQFARKFRVAERL